MKRMRMWLRELSLTQQLLSIIFAFIVAFAAFIVIFLSPSIDAFSDSEMYRLLHNSQENIISIIDSSPGSTPQMSIENSSITHMLYNPSTDEIHVISGSMIRVEVKDELRKNLHADVSGTQDLALRVQNGDGSGEMVRYLYCATLMKDGRQLISILANDYQIQFQSSLINGVVLMNILVVSLLFVLLMIWVGSLIMPLNQIRSYIGKIQNDEPAVLNVRRHDEIGQVAVALTDMESELEKQNREKEEMIQNISHDLKTPIATIKSYSEAIKDGIYPYETLEKSVDVIIEHADRLEKKVKSLIILNKMGYLLDNCPEGDQLDMNRVISKALLSLKVVRPEITFIRETEPGIRFHGDEEPWRITVENLIDNALRYAKTSITVTLKEGELCVINDGRPIEEDRLGKLFHAYEKGTDGQFGLGLSIVYRVCATYGYHVEASNLPEGVCFRIWKDSSVKPRKQNKKSRKIKDVSTKKSTAR